MGVSNRAPPLPVLVMVKVEPLSSCGLTWLPRVRGSEVVNTLSQTRNVQVTSVLNHRNQQTTRGVYGNTDVLYRVVGNFLAVDRGVELGVSLERFGGSLHKERQEGQLSAVSSQEGVLGASTQRSDPGVTSTSTTVVSCAEVCSDSIMRVEMT